MDFVDWCVLQFLFCLCECLFRSVLICSSLSSLVCSDLVCSGLVWYLVWSGLAWLGLFSLVCARLVLSGLVWSGLVWSGQKFISVSAAYSKVTKSRIHLPHHALHFFSWPHYNYIELKLWPYTWPNFLAFKKPNTSPHVLNIQPGRISWNSRNNFVCPWC
jgi:hypothetical protein